MPVPLALLASSAVGCMSWFGYRQMYESRRQFWKETGERVRRAPVRGGLKVSVVIPCYNEEENIEACVVSVLDNCDGISDLQVIVVDDMSRDRTVEVATRVKQAHPKGNLLTIISAGPRPDNDVWLGKCWAVYQASKHCTGDHITFLDCDVKLKPGGLQSAVQAAIHEDCDLLSGDVAFSCKCAAEKLVQPLVIMNLVLNNNHKVCNDDTQPVASAAGHIMIFKRSSYEAFGGHSVQGVRDHVVEDVMLGYFVKCAAKGTVRFYDFTSVAEIQMYNTTSELFEGYTKNIFLAFDQSIPTVLAVSVLNVAAFGLPLVSLVWGLALLGSSPTSAVFPLMSYLYSTYTQYAVRRQLEEDGRISAALWWTHPLGALGLVSIALISMVKGVTGIGWTWKGRPLRMPEAPDEGPQEAEMEKKER